MEKFRIQNYKKIHDTDWIRCGDLTTFVGKNESGKSALFRGLSKINPSDKEKYDGLTEFPRKRYADEFRQEDWPVSSVKFTLEDGDVDTLTKICLALKKATSVVVTRHYSNNYNVEFKPINLPFISIESYLRSLKQWKEIIDNAVTSEGRGDRLGEIKTNINPIFSQIISQLETSKQADPVDIQMVQQISTALTSNLNEEWEREQFQKIVTQNKKIHDISQMRIEIKNAETWIIENMPQYIYFSKYDIIDSAIHIQSFIQRIKNEPTNPQLRATKCLFQQSGLDVEEIRDLDPTSENYSEEFERRAHKRQILTDSAADAMTQKFEGWWEQRKHKFAYRVDGQFFRVWVYDDLDSSKIELEQRSTGMQYFFSFYLVFLAESLDTHKNSILLLDEPGLHYHATAQRKMVEFLQKLSQENQLLYSTHSPFMIDGDRLQDVRIVYEDKQTGYTLVSSDVWPTDKETLFPLQAGLGYSLAQTLFYSKYNFVVEGLIDQSLLKVMNEILAKKNMTTLNSNIVIVPSGGVRNMMPLASLLVGNSLKLAVLLDSDLPGIQKGIQLQKEHLDCLFVNEFVEKTDAELEDLFSEDIYLDTLKDVYPDTDVSFNADEKSISCITKRINKAFKRLHGGEFSKWKVANALIEKIQKDSSIISEDTCMAFEQIFIRVNSILKNK